MKPWREVAKPHADVLAGTFVQSDFAVDIMKVVDGSAPDEYRNPEAFSVFNDGRIRPTPRDAAREICAVGAPMLAMQGASRFWVADVARPEAAPYQSKLLTWENFFLNADTNVPVNAQIELFQNGDFTTRSNNVERVFRRINPDDWDGDGLANEIDPNPMAYDGDLFGTGVAWLNANCGSVLSASADTNGEIAVSWHTNACGALGDRALP